MSYLFTHEFNTANATQPLPHEDYSQATIGNSWWTRRTAPGPGVGPRGTGFLPKGLKIGLAIVGGISLWVAIMTSFAGGNPPAWLPVVAWFLALGMLPFVVADSMKIHPSEWKFVAKGIAKIAVLYGSIFAVQHIVHSMERAHAAHLADAVSQGIRQSGS